MNVQYLLFLPFALFVTTCSSSKNISNTDSSQTVFLKDEYQQFVNNFKNTLKNGDKEKLAQLFRFPLNRVHPIPDIRDSSDFIKRYDHLFDDELIREILNSSTEKDWQSVGWRGITLNQGIVWIDYDGYIMAINKSTKNEELYKQVILNEMSKSLHSSVREYKSPNAYLETDNLRIRIDVMPDGTYRYTEWPITNKMIEKPDLILEKGTMAFDGSGGNHHYTFLNNRYTYKIFVNRMDIAETPPAKLTIYKDDQIILEEDAIQFDN